MGWVWHSVTMSKARKRRVQRARQHQKAAHKGVGGIPRFPGPATRLPKFFEVLDDITSTADRALLESSDAVTRLRLIDRVVFVRGINLLKASRILLAEGHWEVAASATRQLFELRPGKWCAGSSLMCVAS
jgi:hypothetical protein